MYVKVLSHPGGHLICAEGFSWVNCVGFAWRCFISVKSTNWTKGGRICSQQLPDLSNKRKNIVLLYVGGLSAKLRRAPQPGWLHTWLDKSCSKTPKAQPEHCGLCSSLQWGGLPWSPSEGGRPSTSHIQYSAAFWTLARPIGTPNSLWISTLALKYVGLSNLCF